MIVIRKTFVCKWLVVNELPPPISAFDIFSVCDFVVDEFVCKFALRREHTLHSL